MEKTDKIEKIEVGKGNRSIYYTGILTDQQDGWVEIHTVRKEVLNFRKEQILQRRKLTDQELGEIGYGADNGVDTNGKNHKDV